MLVLVYFNCFVFFFIVLFFFFNDTATTEIYTLSLHDALPIYIEPKPKLSSFGYAESGSHKMTSLKRHYLNEDARDKALEKLSIIVSKKRYGSVGFPLTGEEKTWTKQDFCIQAITITNGTTSEDCPGVVHVFYRTTEIIKKFGADLVFLRDEVLPPVEEICKLNSINFYFSNLTVHPMFFPTLLSHINDPVTFLEDIKVEDANFHRGIVKWMTKYLEEGETSWVQKFSQARQTHSAMLRLMAPRKRRLLKWYFKK